MTDLRPLVLCIDSDARTLEILAKVLARLPVRQMAARDGETGIALAAKWQPDLLVLDLNLPDLAGWRALEAIRRGPHKPAMRVLVLNARDNTAERLLATNIARVDAYLGKPFDVPALARGMLDLLGLPLDQVVWEQTPTEADAP